MIISNGRPYYTKRSWHGSIYQSQRKFISNNSLYNIFELNSNYTAYNVRGKGGSNSGLGGTMFDFFLGKKIKYVKSPLMYKIIMTYDFPRLPELIKYILINTQVT